MAAIGVFFGAVLSNGMMDIARHGIFHPVNFSFYEIMCILLAVMVTDVVLLDVFNTLGFLLPRLYHGVRIAGRYIYSGNTENTRR